MDELEVSELGSKEYWDKRYEEEIDNFENHGDPGEIWFGENIVAKTIKWIKNHKIIEKSSKILDLGCGNGMFLVELAKDNFTNLSGVDYSEAAIKLAQSIAKRENHNIQYKTCNILEGLNGEFDLIHDKGTYDAVSLSADARENKILYLKHVQEGLKSGGYFIITSCNWTKNELQEHFEKMFVLVDVIPTPQFQFGGKTGNVVTSLIYKKKI